MNKLISEQKAGKLPLVEKSNPSGSSSQPLLSEALGAEKRPLGLPVGLVQTGR